MEFAPASTAARPSSVSEACCRLDSRRDRVRSARTMLLVAVFRVAGEEGGVDALRRRDAELLERGERVRIRCSAFEMSEEEDDGRTDPRADGGRSSVRSDDPSLAPVVHPRVERLRLAAGWIVLVSWLMTLLMLPVTFATSPSESLRLGHCAGESDAADRSERRSANLALCLFRDSRKRQHRLRAGRRPGQLRPFWIRYRAAGFGR